jgi:hypothetical protein
LALALHLILALYGWLRYFERREKQWLFLASINLGLAVATKHTSLLFLFLICAGLALRLGQTERNLKQVIKPMLVAVGLGLAFALPWYLRSILATGNPFFPYLTSVFGAPPQWWDSVTENSLKGFMEKFGQPRTLPNLLVLPWDMTIHAARYDGTFGPLFLILLPLLVLQRWTRILKALFAFIFLVIAVWASPLLSFQMRFLIPLAPVLAVLGAYAFARLSTLVRAGFRRWGTVPLTLVFGALLVLNLPTFTVLHETDRVEWKGWLTSVLHDVPWKAVTGAESEGAYLQHNLKSFAVWNFANQNLPKYAKVLTWSSGDKLYAQRDYIWSNATSIRPIIWAGAGNDSRILPMMRQFGITHLIVDKRPPDSAYPWDNYAILGEVARANWYEKLYEDYNYVLYRVRWEQLDSQIAGASK